MTWLKRNFHRIMLSFAIAVLIAGVAFYARVLTHKSPKTEREAVNDSLAKYSASGKSHGDSAAYHKNNYEILTAQSDSLDNLDSLSWARERAKYRAEWDRKNRR